MLHQTATAQTANALCERKSSIETEPRTLYEIQVQNAREGAIDIMNTREAEEALSIFTEGSQPVLLVKEMEALQNRRYRRALMEGSRKKFVGRSREDEVPDGMQDVPDNGGVAPLERILHSLSAPF